MIARVTLAVLVGLFAFSPDARAGAFLSSKDPVPGRYIVVFKDSAVAEAGSPAPEPDSEPVIGRRAARVSRMADAKMRKHRGKVRHAYERVLKGFAAEMTKAEALALAQDPDVAFVEEDGLLHLDGNQANPPWGLDRIDRAEGLDQRYIYWRDGTGVTVYVVDSGIRATHQEFTGRVAAGYSALSASSSTDDCRGHGTHVAGTIGGKTYGVAKNVTLVPVRVFNCAGSTEHSTAIRALDWVVAQPARPAVVNMSLGGGVNTAFEAAVQRVIDAGIPVVVSAGNWRRDACVESPARIPAAITVGATDSNDQRSIWSSSTGSNYGPCLDIFAPGTNIVSAYKDGDTSTATANGTSMAAPHVTGVVAHYLQTYPTATPAEVAAALVAGAHRIPNTYSLGTGSPPLRLYTRFAEMPAPVISNVSVPARVAEGTSGYVTWSTNVPTDAVLWYSDPAGYLLSHFWRSVSFPERTTEHAHRFMFTSVGTYLLYPISRDENGRAAPSRDGGLTSLPPPPGSSGILAATYQVEVFPRCTEPTPAFRNPVAGLSCNESCSQQWFARGDGDGYETCCCYQPTCPSGWITPLNGAGGCDPMYDEWDGTEIPVRTNGLTCCYY